MWRTSFAPTVRTGAGQLLNQAELLDIPGNSGLRCCKAPGPQLFQQLFLGVDVLGLHNIQNLALPYVLHWLNPPSF